MKIFIIEGQTDGYNLIDIEFNKAKQLTAYLMHFFIRYEVNHKSNVSFPLDDINKCVFIIYVIWYICIQAFMD